MVINQLFLGKVLVSSSGPLPASVLALYGSKTGAPLSVYLGAVHVAELSRLVFLSRFVQVPANFPHGGRLPGL